MPWWDVSGLEALFDIDVTDVMDKPLVRVIVDIFWLYMACLALRDVIASKGLSVDSLFGFAFCTGVVIYSFWPRKDKDEIRREIADEVRRQVKKELEEWRS